jgi:fumarylacetoacetase
MKLSLKQTWNPELSSFITSEKGSLFPIQHLPLGVFKPISDGNYRIGTRIGNYVLDLTRLDDYGMFDEFTWGRKKLFDRLKLNRFMSLGNKASEELRCRLAYLLDKNCNELQSNKELLEVTIPVDISDYTDFYSSKEHAVNLGTMFRGKDNALNENWLHMPIGYHGRSSTVVSTGTPIKRPSGQLKPNPELPPVFGPCKQMDFEIEMGFFIGKPSKMGQAIEISDAEDHIWGMVILNDWSARDIQRWEYIPLGPFLAKNFATSISPWVVTRFALEPFRVLAPEQEPKPLPYLSGNQNAAYDIHIQADIKSDKMEEWQKISLTNFKYLYWTQIQQLAHHTITGCKMSTGDLLGSGTISGPTPDSYGSMIELSWKGEKPIKLIDGSTRTFLNDGDSIRLSAWCENQSYKIGFGEVSGEIIP